MTGVARASFAAAQRAVRLSPQPGLRSEAGVLSWFCPSPRGRALPTQAEHFRFFPAKLAPGPEVPLPRSALMMPRFEGPGFSVRSPEWGWADLAEFPMQCGEGLRRDSLCLSDSNFIRYHVKDVKGSSLVAIYFSMERLIDCLL